MAGAKCPFLIALVSRFITAVGFLVMLTVNASAGTTDADYVNDPVRRTFEARIPYPPIDLTKRTWFVEKGAQPTIANSRSVIRVKLQDGRRLVLENRRPVDLRSVVDGESDANLWRFAEGDLASAEWYAEVTQPEDAVVADWRKAEAFWQRQLIDPRTLYTVVVTGSELESAAFALSQIPIIEHLDIATYSGNRIGGKLSDATIRSSATGDAATTATPTWISVMEIDKVHNEMGISGRNVRFVMATLGVPVPGPGIGFPPMHQLSGYGPFAATAQDNYEYGMAALAIPHATLGCVRVSDLNSTEIEDFKGGLGAVVGLPGPLIYESGWAIGDLNSGLVLPLEWDATSFQLIGILVGAGKTVLEWAGSSGINLDNPSQYPPKPHLPFIRDSGAIIVQDAQGINNYGNAIDARAPSPDGQAAASIGISAALVESALQVAGQSVPGTAPRIHGGLANRNLGLGNARNSVRSVLARFFPNPTLRVQANAPDHTLYVNGVTRALGDVDHNILRTEGLRIYNDGNASMTVKASFQVVNGTDPGACVAKLGSSGLFQTSIPPFSGTDLKLEITPRKPGAAPNYAYTCRLSLDVNDSRLSTIVDSQAGLRRWSMDFTFRVPARPGAVMRIDDQVGNHVRSGQVFEFGRLEGTYPEQRLQQKVLYVRNEPWADRNLTLSIPDPGPNPRFDFGTPMGLPPIAIDIPPGDYRTLTLKVWQKLDPADRPEKTFTEDITFTTNDDAQRSFTLRPKVTLRSTLGLIEFVQRFPRGFIRYHGGQMAEIGLGDVYVDEWGTQVVKIWGAIRAFATGTKVKWKEYTGPIDSIHGLVDPNAKTTLGKVIPYEKIVSATEIIDIAVNALVPPPEQGRFLMPVMVEVTPPGGTSAETYYVLLTATLLQRNGPSRLGVVQRGCAPCPQQVVGSEKTGELNPSVTADEAVPMGGTVSFGQVQLGSSVRREFTLTNHGDNPLTIRGLWVEGQGFAADLNGTTIPPRTFVILGVTMSGLRRGPASARLSFYVDGTGDTSNFFLMKLAGSVCDSNNCTSSTPIIDSFSVMPAAVPRGESATLSWRVTNASSVTIQPGNLSVSASGTRTETPASTTDYILTAVNGLESATRSVRLTVVGDGPPGSPSITSFRADPQSVGAGQPSTLSWSVANATSLTITPGDTVTGTSSTTVSPTATTTYILSATNSVGTSSRMVTVTVNPTTSPVINSFDVAPATLSGPGQSTVLSWDVSNAATIAITPNVGNVPASGSRTMSPSVSTTYTLQATNAAGTTTRAKTVVVDGTYNPGMPPSIQTFAASSPSVAAGTPVTLSWTVANADLILLAPPMSEVGPTGSLNVHPQGNMTYTLFARNGAGAVSREVAITATGGPAIPEIQQFSVTPQPIVTGNDGVMSWTTANATSVSIAPDIGAVAATGTKPIRPAIDSLYVLTATNAAGSASRAVAVDTAPPPPRPLTKSIEIRRGTEIATGVRLEDEQTTHLYDPIRGYAAGSLPLLIVNRSPAALIMAGATVDNHWGGADVFSLSSELNGVTIAPDQAVPVILRWAAPTAPRGYEAIVTFRTQDGTAVWHRFRLGVPEWRAPSSPMQIRLTTASNTAITADFVQDPFTEAPTTIGLDLGVASSTTPLSTEMRVHNDGSASVTLTQAWCAGVDFTIAGDQFPTSIPASGHAPLRVSARSQTQSLTDSCYVQVGAPGDAVGQGTFAAFRVRAYGQASFPNPQVSMWADWVGSSPGTFGHGSEVVVKLPQNYREFLHFYVRNPRGGTTPRWPIHLVRSGLSVAGNGFRFWQRYIPTTRVLRDLLTIEDVCCDEVAFVVDFAGKPSGVYIGTVKMKMWASPNDAPPYAWEQDFELRIKVIVARSRKKVLHGGAELNSGSGFDADEPAIFTIENTGDTTLRLSNLAVPLHYRVASGLPLSLQPGQSGALALERTGPATSTGPHHVSFSTDDPDEPIFWLRENHKPVAVSNSITVSPGESVPIDVVANDTDTDGDGVALTERAIVTLPRKGSAVPIDESTISYTANAGTTGSDRFVYEISDGHGGIARGEVWVTIGTANRTPIANPDAARTKLATAVTIDVLANDSDPDGDAINLTSDPILVPAAHGTASAYGAMIRYTPNTNFDGVDTFTYEITDGFSTATAVVTVTVTNTRPVATADAFNTRRNETITFNVTSNDSDADGDFIFLIAEAIAVPPAHGTAVRVDDHRIRYTPARSFVGTDSLAYEIGDGHGLRASAQVTVEVANSGPPAARNDHATTKRDTAVIIDVLTNDQDIDGQAIVLTVDPIKTPPRNGTAERFSNTSVRYTPAPQWGGNDVFEYEIADVSGNKDRAWVAVHVGRTRSLPVAVDDTASTTANRSVTIHVVANDTSPDGEALALTGSPFLRRPLNGSVRRVNDATVSYTPKDNWTGTDTFAYEITDSEGGTAGAFVTVTVTAENRPPVAVNDSVSTHSGASVTINVLANDSDPDNDPLTFLAQPAAPAHGTASRVSDSSIAYTPSAGYLGADSFQYEISDGRGGTSRATVTVTVSDTNVAPDAVDDDITTTAGNAVTINVTANDFDPDGDTVSLITSPIITAPANGTAVKVSATSITYTPRAGFTGTDRFQYEIGDHNSARDRAWVDITIGEGTVNHSPVAVDDAQTTREATSTNIVVTANDSDPDGDGIFLIADPIRFAPAHGTAERLSDSTLKYTPAAGFVGIDTLQYEIGDGRGKRARAWVRITVRNPNSRPIAVSDSASTTSGTDVAVNVTANDSDPDGNVVRLVSSPIIVAPAHGTATKVDNNFIKYTPHSGFHGTDRFQYEIGDGNGGRDRAWVNVTVSGSSANSSSMATHATMAPPVADNDKSEGLTDTALPVVVLTNDYAIGGRSVVLAASPVITPPLSGTVQRTSDTTLTYTPISGFRGNDRFEYEVVDEGGVATRAWVTVQIPGDNKTPVAVDDFNVYTYDGSATITPIANDSDADGDALVLTMRAVVTAPLHGTVRRDSDSRLVYTAEPDYRGVDHFVYEITDRRGGMAQATVLISIGTSPEPPVAGADAATVEAGKAVRIEVLANDSDPDGDTLRVVSSEPPVYGSIVWDNGVATYQSHYPHYAGQDTFRYTVSDSGGNTAQAEVTVTVFVPNYPPTVVDDVAETKTRTPVLIGVLANDWDRNYLQKLKVASVTQPARGSVIINNNWLSVTYTPANDFAGTDTFRYTVSDGTDTATALVTVTVLNQAPLPRADVLAAPEDTAVGYQAHNLLANDVDPDGDELHIVSIEQAEYGTFQFSPDFTQFSYRSRENWFGTDRFYYTVSDPFGAQVRLMSQIAVAAVNDSPVANNDSFSVYKNQLLTIQEAAIIANDTDIEGHALRLAAVGAPTNGTATIVAEGVIEYRPYGEFVGADSFEYSVMDSGGASGTGRINVNVLQDTPPVASFTVTCNNLVCSFDAGASTDDRGIVLYDWSLGNGSPAAGKTFTYTYGSTGSYLVKLTVHDAIGQKNTITKTVTVTCPTPTISAHPTSRTIHAGQPTTLTVTASDATGYQWYQGTAPSATTPVGGNSSSLSVQPGATTSYWVKVSNTCGGTDSTTAVVTVCALPSVVAHPASTTIVPSSQATLTVSVSGSGPFSYQWYEGASGVMTTPVGTNSNSFTTPILNATKSYWVKVTSACNGGTVNSNTATVTVTSFANIVRRQKAGSVANSQTSITTNWSEPTQAGTLLVAVISASDQGYPIADFAPPAGWLLASAYELNRLKTAIYYYPNNPGGRTSETFTNGNRFRDMILQLAEYTGVATASSLDKTTYSDGSTPPSPPVVFTGTTAQTTQPKELVITALTAYMSTTFSQPDNQFVEVHDHTLEWIRLSTAVHERVVSATGTWGHSATIDNPAPEQWTGMVTTFKAATLDCSGPPTIQVQPAPATINAGQSATLTVTAAGEGALSYQWYQGSTPIGSNSNSLTVTPAVTTSYSVKVANACGSVSSAPVTVTVCNPPAIATQPATKTIDAGATATLTVTANGSGPLAYQWYEGTSGTTTTPVGTNSSSFTTPALTTSKSYWVWVSSTCNGTAGVGSITAKICMTPGIFTQPASTTINSGATATLTVQPNGTGPFSYQWYEGSSGTITTPVGTNSATFTTPALTATKSYWVRVTSTCNGSVSVNSNAATVTICRPPAIVTQPGSPTINSGSTATLSVSAAPLLPDPKIVNSSPAISGWDVSNVFDDNVNTDYASNGAGTNTFIDFDFGTSAKFTEVTFTDRRSSGGTNGSAAGGGGDNVTAFDLIFSTDATFGNGDDVKVAVTSTPCCDTVVIPITKIVARYVRYDVTATAGGGPNIGAAEFSFRAFDTLSTQTYSYQWYEVASATASTPVGTNSATFTTPALTASKAYWVRVSNSCGALISATATVTVNPPPVRQKTPSDFNGDRVSDFVIYRHGAWFNLSTGGSVWTGESSPSCIPTPADYDGNGITEYSIFCDGAWHLYKPDGSYLKGIWIGVVTDIPVPADYNGDGRDDVVVYRNGTWIGFDYATGAQSWSVTTGAVAGAIPLPMDYDGDGGADFTIYTGGGWHLYADNGSYRNGIWTGGVAGDIPVPGDYDGNGIEEMVIYRGGAWIWFDINDGSARGVWTGATSQNGDPLLPAPLDYDGDGSVDFAVLAGGPFHSFFDDGSYRGAVWAGGVKGDLPISRRGHWKATP